MFSVAIGKQNNAILWLPSCQLTYGARLTNVFGPVRYKFSTLNSSICNFRFLRCRFWVSLQKITTLRTSARLIDAVKMSRPEKYPSECGTPNLWDSVWPNSLTTRKSSRINTYPVLS